MKLSKQQQTMFRQLTEDFQSVDSFRGNSRAFHTARALDKQGLALLEPRRDDWVVRLSDDWIRMEHLEKAVNNCEGMPAEHTKAHKNRVNELDAIYVKLR